MCRLKTLAFMLLMALLAGCAPILATPSPAPASPDATPAVSMAVVHNVDVQIPEMEPLQANAIIRSSYPTEVAQQFPPLIRRVTGAPSISH